MDLKKQDDSDPKAKLILREQTKKIVVDLLGKEDTKGILNSREDMNGIVKEILDEKTKEWEQHVIIELKKLQKERDIQTGHRNRARLAKIAKRERARLAQQEQQFCSTEFIDGFGRYFLFLPFKINAL